MSSLWDSRIVTERRVRAPELRGTSRRFHANILDSLVVYTHACLHA